MVGTMCRPSNSNVSAWHQRLRNWASWIMRGLRGSMPIGRHKCGGATSPTRPRTTTAPEATISANLATMNGSNSAQEG